MKRMAHISSAVQHQIIQDYKEKNPDNTYRYKLTEIAQKHEISLSSLHILARMARCNGRKRGGNAKMVPDARTMKILRDATEPGITFDAVGERNPRIVNGKKVPITKSRVSKIIQVWKKRLGKRKLYSKGFNEGDIIEWADQRFTVLRYDNSHRGAVQELLLEGNKWVEGKIIDPFCWIYQGQRSKLIKSVVREAEELVSKM